MPNMNLTVRGWARRAFVSLFVTAIFAEPLPSDAASSAPLVLSGSPPASVTVGQAYSFRPTVSGGNGTALRFAINTKPAWAQFNTSTGQLWGTPTAAGTWSNIYVKAMNTGQSAVFGGFSIQVKWRPPQISGKPPTTATVGVPYVFTPTATDPYGRALRFSLSSKPSWMVLNSLTGQISGTPTAKDVGVDSGISIQVSDGYSTAYLPAFSIKVSAAAASSKPTISGTPPATVTAGSTYSFQPMATDANGAALSFSVQGKPSWSTFSIATGKLSGTPTTSQVGTYGNIIISVSDGKSSAALPAFSIKVVASSIASPTGSATLTWNVPTTNTNGTPLTNLAGYYLRYGTSTNDLSEQVQIADPGDTSYTIAKLTPGVWYFGISAYTASGQQSSLSNIASATIE